MIASSGEKSVKKCIAIHFLFKHKLALNLTHIEI